MLNLVPIQFLALFGYFILRVVIGLVFLYLARNQYAERQSLAQSLNRPFIPGLFAVTIIVAIESIIGVLFILGAFTQVAAVLAVLWSLALLLCRTYFSHPSLPTPQTTVLILAIALSLFITGAGVLAFDLPI